MTKALLLLSIAAFIPFSTSWGAVILGQVDTFQNGTTQGWTAGGGPMGQMPPVPPHLQSSGGPAGAGDAFLVITSQGGTGPGSNLTSYNIFGQWSDNYLTNGVSAISMDLMNLGRTSLTIRLQFENPFAGGDEAITNTGFSLAPDSGWTHAVFPVGLNQLTALAGSVSGALGNTSVLRIVNAPAIADAVPVAGVLGVDNIAAAVPEPGTIAVAGLGLALIAFRAYSRT